VTLDSRQPASRPLVLHPPLQQLMHQRLIRHPLLPRHLSKLCEQGRGDPQRDQLLGVPSSRTSHSAGLFELLVGEFGDIGVIDLAIWYMPRSLCGTLASC
jgi:hypothetical protein